jgi:2-methylcitrate dehydratase PrpD
MAEEATQTLATFAARLGYDDIPQRVRDHCKTLLLDALACALAGRFGEETGRLRRSPHAWRSRQSRA